MELASLAAVMSSPAERPEVTAERAMAIFRACRKEIWNVAKELHDTNQWVAERNEESEPDDDFIASLEFYNDDPSGAVTLDSFLNACSAGSKLDIRISKWRSFAKFSAKLWILKDGTQDRCRLNDLELKAAGDKMANFHEVNGIARDKVLTMRDTFSIWQEMKKVGDAEVKAEKSKRAKIYLPVCRKVVNNQNLTNQENEVLKDMTGDEVESARKKLLKDNELGPNGFGKLKAAIVDASRPKSALPRVSKKRSEK